MTNSNKHLRNLTSVFYERNVEEMEIKKNSANENAVSRFEYVIQGRLCRRENESLVRKGVHMKCGNIEK